MGFDIFPQSVDVLPSDTQLFQIGGSYPPAFWRPLADNLGVVQSDYPDSKSDPVANESVFAINAYELARGIREIEWTLEPHCSPLSAGVLRFSVFLPSPGGTAWNYDVRLLGSGEVEIFNELGSKIADLPQTLASGHVFKIEIVSGFRLYVNGVLIHERTSLGAAVSYPAHFWATVSGATLPFVQVGPAV